MGKVRLDAWKLCQSVPLILGLLITGTPDSVPAATDGTAPCSDATAIDLNHRLPGLRTEAGESDCYQIDVRSPGILLLDTATPGRALVEPRLGFLGRVEGKEYALNEQSATRVVVTISRPGAYFFYVAAQDPLLPLDEYTLTSLFVAEEASFLKDEDEGEIDPILICPTDGDGDPGDSVACASPLESGENLAGALWNAGMADDDYFTFVLTTQQTVLIETSGETDTFGGLYDRRGYRLAADDDGGNDGNFRIAKTLVPGRYYVRVEGWGADEGAYTLMLETLDW
ncbi:MAG: hypothetical protein GY856_53460 [bacterium]|nr:hypothetical protein [bacterium]